MRSALSVLLAFALAACGSPSPAAQPHPAMWKVSDPDTTIYLFGTIHVLPANFRWRTKKFDKIEKSANQLVLEIADQGDKAKTAQVFGEMAVTPGLPPLADRVPANKRDQLAALMKKGGFAPGQLDKLETWAAAIMLGVSLYSDIGVSADNGVEKQLLADFQTVKKPVEGLETTPQQLGYFDALPESAQRTLLASILDEAQGSSAEFEKMIRAWSKGDTKAISLTFDDELKLSPDLATVLVAVGAGHLAGKGSVIELLKKEGLKVQRVQ